MSLLMNPRNSLTLAMTKLLVRRVRLALTLLVMSLLFAVLVFICVAVAGIEHSAQNFNTEALGGRFIVQAKPILNGSYGNNALQKELEQPNTAIVNQKKALAKKYGLVYDPANDFTLPLLRTQTGSGAGDVTQTPNDESSIAIATLAKLNQAQGADYQSFVKLAQDADALHTYRSSSKGSSGSPQNIKILEDNKEDFTTKRQGYSQPIGLQSLSSLGWNQMSDDLLKPFLLQGQSTEIGADGSIPITMPFSAAEQLLGHGKLPATATDQQKLERLRAVRAGAAGRLATVCYRNTASQELLQEAIQQQAHIEANKNKVGYVPPALQYNMPAVPCGAVTVKKDIRTHEEKLATDHQKELDAVGEPAVAPEEGSFKIRIVGITPDVNTGTTTMSSIDGILSSLFSSSLGQGWFSPVSAFQPGTIATKAQGGQLTNDASDQSQLYYAEFATLEAAKQFINNFNCTEQQITSTDFNAVPRKCAEIQKPFQLSAYGNNVWAINDLKRTVEGIARYVLVTVMVVAVIIMMATLGKVIADSRRETAVFRALGARRLHIVQIYLTYSIIIGAFITILSGFLGTLAATIVNHYAESQLSISAVLAYNAQDLTKHFSLIGFNPMYTGVIVTIIMASAVLATAIPLALNVRRNPMRDMRDE